MYKILILDLDGTLLRSDNTISENTKNTIKRLRKSGVLVSVASGRSPVDVGKYIEELELFNSYHITNNGASIFKYNREVRYKEGFSESEHAGILTYFRKHNIELGVQSPHKNEFVYHNAPTLASAVAPTFIHTKAIEVSADEIDSLYSVFKFTAYFHDKKEYDIIKDIENLYQASTFRVGPDFIDIMPKGITKFAGAKTISYEMDVPLKEMIAIGDNENDIEIVTNIGLGVSMKNGVEELKEVADIVLEKTNNEDGVAYFINEYLLK